MFAYCNNNPINYIDENGKRAIKIDNNETVGDATEGLDANLVTYVTGSKNASPSVLILEAKTKPNMTPRKDKRRGSENRQKSGDRERNVGHPNGEEHSRVPKGNNGLRKTVAVGGLIVTSAAIVFIVVNNITGVGTADDHMLEPNITVWWDYAYQIAN